MPNINMEMHEAIGISVDEGHLLGAGVHVRHVMLHSADGSTVTITLFSEDKRVVPLVEVKGSSMFDHKIDVAWKSLMVERGLA